jgi:hypothetical protein
MKRLSLVVLVLASGCLPDEEGEPPHADRIACPSQLALTGGPYMVQCTVDFTSPDHNVDEVNYKAVDSGGATWAEKRQVPTGLVNAHEGSVVFTISETTQPALGALTITASLFEIDQGQQSNDIIATVMVVSP